MTSNSGDMIKAVSALVIEPTAAGTAKAATVIHTAMYTNPAARPSSLSEKHGRRVVRGIIGAVQ